VLIHGLPGTAEDWEDVTPLLAGHRTIAIDRPGFGYSSGGYLPFNRQLEAIHELLAKLDVTRPILVGHSYGGTISLGLAERYPSDVSGLVLVGDSEAFHPLPVVAAHRRRLLAINMTHGNLEAWAGETLAADGVIAQIDKHLSTIHIPAVVIQGEQDELVKPAYGRQLAAELPDARLQMVYGGHMQPYDHPATIAAAVQSLW
jgi:pimeloyl-ACP methyl ester carboxylesterase